MGLWGRGLVLVPWVETHGYDVGLASGTDGTDSWDFPQFKQGSFIWNAFHSCQRILSSIGAADWLATGFNPLFKARCAGANAIGMADIIQVIWKGIYDHNRYGIFWASFHIHPKRWSYGDVILGFWYNDTPYLFDHCISVLDSKDGLYYQAGVGIGHIEKRLGKTKWKRSKNKYHIPVLEGWVLN